MDIIDSSKNLFKRLQNTRPQDVLMWVKKNSTEATAKGLPNWVDQGLFFATTLGKPQCSLLQENSNLQHFYGQPLLNVSVPQIAQHKRQFYTKRINGLSILAPEKSLIQNIGDRANHLGEPFTVSAHSIDEECERELELEIKEEEEIEIQVPFKNPVSEITWDYDTIFTADAPISLPTTVLSISNVIRQYMRPKSLRGIQWCDKVACTENFIKSVTDAVGGEEKCLNHYLRLIDSAVLFSGGHLLLLSEREADSILVLFWEQMIGTLGSRPSKCVRNVATSLGTTRYQYPLFLQHAFARKSADDSLPAFLMLPERVICGKIGNEMLASVQLFGGETMYRTKARKKALRKILLNKKRLISGINVSAASGEPEHLVAMRGLLHLFPHSDLEVVFVKVASEVDYG